jgi:amino acid transporter
MALGVLMVLFLIHIMATYYLFSISMPRSGGEYLYASRGLHPALGFFACWALTIIGISWSGQLTSWEVTYGIADLIYNAGVLGGNVAAINLGIMLNEVNSVAVFLVGIPILLLAFGVIWAGAKTVMRVSWACFIMSFIGLIAIVVASVTSSQELFASRLAELGGISYSEIIAAAQEEGMVLGLTSIGSTVMAGMTYINLNTLGSTYTTNVSGEIKQVGRAQPLALFGSLGLFMLFWGIFYGTMWYAAAPGGDFWIAIAYLQNIDAYSLLPVFPIASQVMLYVTENPILIYLATIGFLFGNFGGIVGLSFGPTRNIFAFSFDRIFPERWAKVDRRGSPYISVAVAFLIALFVFTVYTFTDWMQYILFTITVWFLGWCVTGIAAMTFPWVRKDIFDKSPGPARRMIGGVPLITIIGLLTFIVSAYTVYATTWPLFAGEIPAGNYVTAAIYVIVPFIIFAISYYYRKSKGVPMEKQFAQIPPD